MNNLAQSIGAPAPQSASPAPPPVPAPPVSAAKGSPTPSPGTKQTPEVSREPSTCAMPLKTAPAPPVVPPFKTRALPLQEAAQPEPQPSTVERALEMPAAAHAAAAPKTRVIRLERSFGTLNPTSAGLAGIGVRFITYAGSSLPARIEFVNPDGAAGRSGLIQVNDEIVAIDGHSVLGLNSIDISNLIRGPPGSAVSITLLDK